MILKSSRTLLTLLINRVSTDGKKKSTTGRTQMAEYVVVNLIHF